MCARNAGQYLAVKEVGNKTVYKAFCGQHSQQARNRDRELGLAIEVYFCACVGSLLCQLCSLGCGSGCDSSISHINQFHTVPGVILDGHKPLVQAPAMIVNGRQHFALLHVTVRLE